MVTGHHGHQKKLMQTGIIPGVIDHHLDQVEEIPTSSYGDELGCDTF